MELWLFIKFSRKEHPLEFPSTCFYGEENFANVSAVVQAHSPFRRYNPSMMMLQRRSRAS